MVSFLYKSRSSAASVSSASLIPDIVCISCIELFLGRPLLSSLTACQHHVLIHTVCLHHMAKEHHLLFCCALSRNKSPLTCPMISINIDSIRLFYSQSKTPSASFSRSTFCWHQFSSPFLLSLSMSRNHKVSQEISYLN